jgi:hypothetical protein
MGRAKGNVHRAATNSRFAFDQPVGPEANLEEIALYAREEATRTRRLTTQREKDEYFNEVFLRLQRRQDPKERHVELPSRRMLEALLALDEGVSQQQFAQANIQRPWSQLNIQAMGVAIIDENGYPSAGHRLAVYLESRMRWPTPYRDSYERARKNIARRTLPDVHDPRFAHLVEKIGKGAKSGLIADYSRAELRKLLGVLEREVKHLSHDQLLAMADDGGLLPKYSSSPSHGVLALAYASRQLYGDFDKGFRRAMRMPYQQLMQRPSSMFANDDGRLQDHEILRQLLPSHPLLVASDGLTNRVLQDAANMAGISAKAGTRNLQGIVPVELKSALDLQHEQHFRDFVQDMGGQQERLGSVKRSLSSGRSFGRRRSCLAYYDPSTGDIHLRTMLADNLRGKEVSPQEAAIALSTVAHELFHAIGKRDYGSGRTGIGNESTAEHTLDEGTTEALARLHWKKLGQKLQMSTAHTPQYGPYPLEVQSVVALTAYIQGEFDEEKLREGGYNQPQDLSDKAQEWMLSSYTEYGPGERLAVLARYIRERTGLETHEAYARVKDYLCLCKGEDRTEISTRLATFLASMGA